MSQEKGRIGLTLPRLTYQHLFHLQTLQPPPPSPSSIKHCQRQRLAEDTRTNLDQKRRNDSVACPRLISHKKNDLTKQRESPTDLQRLSRARARPVIRSSMPPRSHRIWPPSPQIPQIPQIPLIPLIPQNPQNPQKRQNPRRRDEPTRLRVRQSPQKPALSLGQVKSWNAQAREPLRSAAASRRQLVCLLRSCQ